MILNPNGKTEQCTCRWLLVMSTMLRVNCLLFRSSFLFCYCFIWFSLIHWFVYLYMCVFQSPFKFCLSNKPIFVYIVVSVVFSIVHRLVPLGAMTTRVFEEHNYHSSTQWSPLTSRLSKWSNAAWSLHIYRKRVIRSSSSLWWLSSSSLTLTSSSTTVAAAAFTLCICFFRFFQCPCIFYNENSMYESQLF